MAEKIRAGEAYLVRLEAHPETKAATERAMAKIRESGLADELLLAMEEAKKDLAGNYCDWPTSFEQWEELALQVGVPSDLVESGEWTAGDIRAYARWLVANVRADVRRKKMVEAIRADELGSVETPNSIDLTTKVLLGTYQAAADDNETKIVAIAADASKSANDRMRTIAEIDSRVYGWTSTKWADLLHVKDAAIRQTDFWKVDRPRVLRPE